METNHDPSSEAMCIHCKRERRQNINYSSNWTQYPKHRLWIGNNCATGPSQPKPTTNQTRVLPKRTYISRKPQSTKEILVESNTTPLPNTLSPLQAESITDLAQTAGINITNIPEAEVYQVLTAALTKYRTQTWIVQPQELCLHYTYRSKSYNSTATENPQLFIDS